jgi:MFS family permease
MSHTDAASQNQPAALKNTTLGLWAVFITYFATIFFFRGIGVSLPKVAADLDGMHLYSWSISLPALAASFATLLFGKLSDVYGRRLFILISLILYMAGTILSALAANFTLFIAFRMVLSLGQGALSSLCFATLGDMYSPVERSRWSGLLQIPAGIAAIIGPTMVGMITDKLSWRYFFWLAVLLAAISTVLVMGGVTSQEKRTARKIDYVGSFLLALALAVMIVAFSWAGSTYPWASIQIIGLLALSVVLWAVLLWVEKHVEEPVLDPRVMTNRTFLTVAVSGLLSYFGMLAVTMYYPLFLQGVQETSATLSGKVVTPFGIIMAFMGVPAGYLIAKTKRYKWMLISGYTILTAATFAMVVFDIGTPIWLGILVTSLSGLGLGAIPTINTLVSQFAVPKKLLGAAVGAIFAFVFMGNAIAPAILGSAMNQTYTETLRNSLPSELNGIVNQETMSSMANPRVLLKPEAMSALEKTLNATGRRGPALFKATVQAIRRSLEESLKMVFLISAITTLASWFLILTVPEVSIDSEK